jgi:hypothetical protein
VPHSTFLTPILTQAILRVSHVRGATTANSGSIPGTGPNIYVQMESFTIWFGKLSLRKGGPIRPPLSPFQRLIQPLCGKCLNANDLFPSHSHGITRTLAFNTRRGSSVPLSSMVQQQPITMSTLAPLPSWTGLTTRPSASGGGIVRRTVLPHKLAP